jgi:hypothetical protein
MSGDQCFTTTKERNGERTANIEGDRHKPRSDGDCGDNDLSLPDGNAVDPGPSSDSRHGRRTRGIRWHSHAEDNKRGGENESRIREKLGQRTCQRPTKDDLVVFGLQREQNVRIQTSTIPADGGTGSVGAPISTECPSTHFTI